MRLTAGFCFPYLTGIKYDDPLYFDSTPIAPLFYPIPIANMEVDAAGDYTKTQKMMYLK